MRIFLQCLLVLVVIELTVCSSRKARCKELKPGKLRRCGREFRPVCGVNNKEYPNECMLCLYMDEHPGEVIEIKSEGPCGTAGEQDRLTEKQEIE